MFSFIHNGIEYVNFDVTDEETYKSLASKIGEGKLNEYIELAQRQMPVTTEMLEQIITDLEIQISEIRAESKTKIGNEEL